MFGFVTFVYPETVRLILAKGNPHFVCDSRVLVKPYKEKGKLVPDKYRHSAASLMPRSAHKILLFFLFFFIILFRLPCVGQSMIDPPLHLHDNRKQQQQQADFFGRTTPTALDAREEEAYYDLHQLGARMSYSSSSSSSSSSEEELLWRRKLEEQQQQAAELQRTIVELQARRFMGLQIVDLNNRSFFPSSAPSSFIDSPTITAAQPISSNLDRSSGRRVESSTEEGKPQLEIHDRFLSFLGGRVV
ncbi:hypothetical protein BHE74_00007691 [Ensete ventricosum]|nr:hypothetical protein GW17_00029892 [Ensete ventricosum]RWW83784.1 hypothetical protein BHE74_00007691 [Ensete ventricosum]RZR83606.1 hypothetical protein BHM03_00010255 [Ensete ventricosum]